MANTHKVKTGGYTLLLNSSPSDTEVSDSYQINQINTTSIEDGTDFTVLEEGLGFECQWVRVLVGEQEGYFHSRYIEKLPEAPSSLEFSCQKKIDISFPYAVDWTTKEVNRSYYDKYLQKWCVPVETSIESSGSELQSQLNLYLKRGLRIILRDNGKSHTDEVLDYILGRLVSASADEHHVDPRPNIPIKVLITFPDKYLHSLADISREEAYSLLDNYSVIRLSAATYERDIERVAVIMEQYADKVRQFKRKGSVRGINLKMEADNLRTAATEIASIISDNDIDLKDDTAIEIGLNSNFEATSIAENSLVVYRVILKGAPRLLDSLPFDSPRSMNYLFNLSEIFDKATNDGLTWTEFLEKYTIPRVKVDPTKSDSGPIDIGESIQDAYRSLGIGSGSCSKSVKTEKEIETLKEKYDRIKGDVALHALSKVDFIGDSLFSELGTVISKVKSLDDLYGQVLNKICLTDLPSALALCLETPTLTPEAQRIKNLLPPIDNCAPTDCGFKPVVKIPDNLPTKDWMADYAEIIYKTIIDALTQIFLELIKDIIDTLKSICDGNDDNTKIKDFINTPPDGMNPLLDDLFNLLSARELCSLFQGNASQSTISMVRSTIQKLHPAMAPAYRTKSSIVNLFAGIGNIIDSSFCEDLAGFPTTPSILCDDPFESNEELYAALSEKGDDITEEEIRKQLDKVKERRRDKLDKVATILESIMPSAGGSSGESCGISGLANLLPALLGSGGLVDLKHHTYDHMQDAVFDGVFSSVYTSFNKDSERLKNSLIEKTYERKEVPFKVNFNIKEESHRVINPEIKAMLAKGITYLELGIKEADLENPDFEGPVDKKGTVRGIVVDRDYKKTSRKLKSLLSSLESNTAFESKADKEGFYYELTIPPDPDLAAALETLGNIKDDRIDKLREKFKAMSSWKIRYKVPYMTDQGVDSDIDDDYIIEVFPSNAHETGFRKKGRKELDRGVWNFINSELIDGGDDDIEIPIEELELEETVTADDSIIEEELCLTEEQLSEPQPTKYLTPPPQSVFGRYVHHIWDDALSPIISNLDYSRRNIILNPLGKEIEEHFAQVLYPKASRDLLSLISSQVASSPLLPDSIKTTSLFGVEQQDFIPPLSKFSFQRVPTKLEKACGIDPHLLKIDNYKSEISNNIAQIPQEELLGSMNSAGTDPWSKAVLKSVVKMTIRAYCFDYALRSMFMATEFAIEDSIDGYVKEYLMGRILTEMKKFNPEYPILLSEIANDTYAAKIVVDVDTLDENKGLLEMIGQSLEEVFVDLKCVFKQENFEINSNNVKEQLIQEWLPMIDLPAIGEGRFFNIGQELSTMEEKLKLYIVELPQKRKALAEATVRHSMAEDDLNVAKAALEAKYPGKSAAALEEMDKNNKSAIEKDFPARIKIMKEHMRVKGCGANTNTNSNGTINWAEKGPKPPDLDVNKLTSAERALKKGSQWYYAYDEWQSAREFSGGVPKPFPREKLWRRCGRGEGYIIHQKLQIEAAQKRRDEYKTISTDLSNAMAEFDEAAFALQYAQNEIDSVTTSHGEVVDIKNNVNISQEDFDLMASGEMTPEDAAGIDIEQRFGSLSSVTQDGETVSFDLNNGNFFLERSIRIKRLDFDTMKQRLLDTGLSGEMADHLITEFSQAFYSKVHNVKDADFDTISRGVISAKELNSLILEFASKTGLGLLTHDQVRDILQTANFFAELSPELRLMYIPPVTESQFDDQSGGFHKIISRLRNTHDFAKDATDRLGSVSRAFIATETEERQVFNVATEKVQTEIIDREVYPIPLIDTGRMDDDECEYSGWVLTSLYDLFGLGAEQSEDFIDMYNSSIHELKEKLLNSREFKLMFDFVFPVDRYLSMIMVYNILATSSIDGIPRSFNQTKSNLYSLFNTFKDSYDFRQSGPSNKEVQKYADYFTNPDVCISFDDYPTSLGELLQGDFKTKFKTDWDKDDNPFKDKGLDYIEEMTLETGKVIFKKLVEYVDPNIAAAKQVKKITRALGFCGDMEIPLWMISLGLLPPFLPFPPLPVFLWGLPMWGNGPTLTPFGILYLMGYSWDEEEVNLYSKPSKEDVGDDCDNVETC